MTRLPRDHSVCPGAERAVPVARVRDVDHRGRCSAWPCRPSPSAGPLITPATGSCGPPGARSRATRRRWRRAALVAGDGSPPRRRPGRGQLTSPVGLPSMWNPTASRRPRHAPVDQVRQPAEDLAEHDRPEAGGHDPLEVVASRGRWRPRPGPGPWVDGDPSGARHPEHPPTARASTASPPMSSLPERYSSPALRSPLTSR